MTPSQIILLEHTSKKRAFRYDDMHDGLDAVRTGPRFSAPILTLDNQMRVLWLQGMVALSTEQTLFGDRPVYQWIITDEGKDALANGKDIFPSESLVAPKYRRTSAPILETESEIVAAANI